MPRELRLNVFLECFFGRHPTSLTGEGHQSIVEGVFFGDDLMQALSDKIDRCRNISSQLAQTNNHTVFDSTNAIVNIYAFLLVGAGSVYEPEAKLRTKLIRCE